jgi:hypothetical protein
VHLAATPAWFADNLAQIFLLILVVVSVLVLGLAHTTGLRFALLAAMAVLALVVYLNRAPLEACARTCECQLAGQEVTVPFCDPDTEL